MIFEIIPALEMLATIVAALINFIKPLVVPIGEVMVRAINVLLAYFPDQSLVLYIVIFAILIVLGVLVNTSPVGDKLKAKFDEFDEKHFGKKKKDYSDDSKRESKKKVKETKKANDKIENKSDEIEFEDEELE
ncbi:MAG: hypothetical protein JW891_02000 [Candidatus Lokiarchaeota archaeon]|nr:hypothetical protein [Candidatus Lokiarchaeota archaeon]